MSYGDSHELTLFPEQVTAEPQQEILAEGAYLFRQDASLHAEQLLQDVVAITNRSPWRNMETPGGRRMSVAMTNCGTLGWITDRAGYRYTTHDPLSGQLWPDLPQAFLSVALSAARKAGYPDFVPDACLINRYEEGARMALHQDRNERDRDQPIVSVSLGIPAVFQFGGSLRSDPVKRYRLSNGDVVVWGGPSRLFFHGIAPVASASHPLTGPYRINLTFRTAGHVSISSKS